MPSFDLLVAAIRERIDYEAVFSEFITLKGKGVERSAFCFAHKNTDTPALGVNVEEGLYCCRNPECGATGDVFTFYQRMRSLTFPEAVRELARRVGLNPDDYGAHTPPPPEPGPVDEETLIQEYLGKGAAPPPAGMTPVSRNGSKPHKKDEDEPEKYIDPAIVDAFHSRLLATTPLLEWLESKRGITRSTIEQYKLGHDGQRYYIPVCDEEGRWVNIRRYKPDAKRSADKMISWRVGFGKARLFPIATLKASEPDSAVYLLEGEMDCLLALQYGLPAVTTTGGAGTWRERWNPLFQDRHVVICYDADDAGRVGASYIANQLSGVARSIKNVVIPLTEPPGADFTDYIVGHGQTINDFLRLVEQSPFFVVGTQPRTIPPDQEPIKLHLSHASKAEYLNVPIRMDVMVSGKTTAPFIVPREVRLGSCGMPGLKMCERCAVATAGGQIVKRIEFESNEILQFINVPDDRLQRTIKLKVGVPGKCGLVKIEATEAINVEEVQVIPEIERTEEETPYVTRAAFFVGHGLQTNRSYRVTGITVPEPRRQYATHLIHTAIQSQSNIDSFRLSEDIVDRLRVFQPHESGEAGLWGHLRTMYDDLEKYTRIYQRRDLMLAVDLTYHSVRMFKFQGELLARGWAEALIIGDSRTGKTTITKRLLDYYGAGEFTTGENTSLAGLVGGLHQVGTSWALQWGRIPLNDRRLIVIDEANNLPTEQISRMSSMRSSGVAEVIKVHTERTSAQTRQIWLTNPRSPRPLSSFTQGVLAVKELVGAPEDIARFDMVVTAASGDVPLAVVNAIRGQETPSTFTNELCHQRVMWAWSRTPEHVVWQEGAESLVLDRATEQGELYRYATEIPLVEPNEQRVKLARLAVSTAAMFFSASEDGHQVIVRPEHVEFAAKFLDTLYKKPSLAFHEYASTQRHRFVLTNSEVVQSILRRNPGAMRSMMEQEQFTQRDLKEILAMNDNDELRAHITTLREAGFLRRQGSSFYLKTPAAIKWLRMQLTGGTGEQVDFSDMMDESVPASPPW